VTVRSGASRPVKDDQQWVVTYLPSAPEEIRGFLPFGEKSAPYDSRDKAERFFAALWCAVPAMRGYVGVAEEGSLPRTNAPSTAVLVAAERLPKSVWENEVFTRNFIYGGGGS
jgi:hypothetical protein